MAAAEDAAREAVRQRSVRNPLRVACCGNRARNALLCLDSHGALAQGSPLDVIDVPSGVAMLLPLDGEDTRAEYLHL